MKAKAKISPRCERETKISRVRSHFSHSEKVANDAALQFVTYRAAGLPGAHLAWLFQQSQETFSRTGDREWRFLPGTFRSQALLSHAADRILEPDPAAPDPRDRVGVRISPHEDISVSRIAEKAIGGPPRLKDHRARILQVIESEIGGPLPRKQYCAIQAIPYNMTGHEVLGVSRGDRPLAWRA